MRFRQGIKLSSSVSKALVLPLTAVLLLGGCGGGSSEDNGTSISFKPANTSKDNGNTQTENTNTDTETETDKTVDTHNEACLEEIYAEGKEIEDCAACHLEGGLAGATKLQFKISDKDYNYAALKSYLALDTKNKEALIQKIDDSSSTSHFGGKFSNNKVTYFKNFVDAYENQDSCVLNNGNTGTTTGGTDTSSTGGMDINVTDDGTITNSENTGTSTNTGNSTNTGSTTNPIEMTAPKLVLLGASSINLTQGYAYVEPGYSAKDYTGQLVNVNVKGSVNTAVVGTYTLLYTATDKHANTSTATRKVSVLAKKTYEYFVDIRGQVSAGQSVISTDNKIYKCNVAGWCNFINLSDDAYFPGTGRAWQSAWSLVGEAQAPVENKLPSTPKLISAQYNYETKDIDVTWSGLSENTQKVQILVNGTSKAEVFGYLSTSSSVSGNFEFGSSYTLSLVASNKEGESVSNDISITLVPLVDKGREYYNRDCKVCHGTNGTNKADLTKWDEVIPFSNWTHNSKMPAAYTATCNDQCLETVGVFVQDILIPRSQNSQIEIGEDVVSEIPRGYRLLNSMEYKNTLESLFIKEVDASKLPLDNIVNGYSSDRNLNRVDEDKLRYFNEMARSYERYLDGFKGSSSQACIIGGFDFCKADKNLFLNSFATKIFRRPLSSKEKSDFASLSSIGKIVGDMIASPKFLYRSEMGVKTSKAGVYQLNQYEVATAIAYAMSGTTPDDELLNLAKNGALYSASTRITQAVRLSKLETGTRKLEDFMGRWLLHDDINSLSDKNPERFPGYDQKVRDAQSKQISEYFKMVMSDLKHSSYSDLLINDKWVTNKTLSDYYKEGTSSSSDFEVIPATSKRFGILTLGAVDSKYANSEEGHPFKRGKFILSRMMCHEVGLPGNGGDVSAIENNVGKNTRDRYAKHSNDKSCVSCHQLIDPIGFVWEKYDGTGRFRTKEWHPDSEGGSKTIDTSVTLKGVLTFNAQENVQASSIRDLSQLIATSDRGPKCMAMQYYRYISGDSLAIVENNKVVDKMASDFKNENYDLESLFNNIVGLKAFITRKGN